MPWEELNPFLSSSAESDPVNRREGCCWVYLSGGRCFSFSSESSRGKTVVKAEDGAIDNGGQRKVLEDLSEHFPDRTGVVFLWHSP